MDRKLFLGILGTTLMALAGAILLPGGRTVDKEPKLPWLITVNPSGAVSVFGLTLGVTTLGEVRELFQEQGKANLFFSPEKETYAIEVYFQRIFLSGLRADMVFTLDIDSDTASKMYERGLRISKISSGAKKIDLAAEDQDAIELTKISHITYIPAADLDDELIAKRFGEPAERLQEQNTDITHWLYPERGLDIAVNPDGKEVLQYVMPENFDQVIKPLRQ
ncbi:hypothetical protein [Candidatus Vondammii sp. HM_W22]|uniref:hypothetical protein n=1 Tax=Candidatus Vondammii sp. HM_W22 TaxID=2687299 RepID=UPI001F12E795|nr:hypothetical protein [Candidatus Vondammii sp. HM_W22]